MIRIRTKLVVGGIALGAAVAALAIAGVREGWVYFLPVDQFLADASYRDNRVRLHGVVSAEEIELNPSLLVANFWLEGDTARLRVQYSGIVPDMFQAGHDVVVEGSLNEQGVFTADTLMTKCASKYESTDGEAPHADPRVAEGSQS